MHSIHGDLIQMAKAGDFNVIVHGANCRGVMGAGIALQIAEHFPLAQQADKYDYENFFPDERTGTYSVANCSWVDSTQPLFQQIRELYVVNAYTQHYPGANAKYEHIRDCFRAIKNDFGNKDYKFGIPQIGCGIGGLQWEQVEKIIDEEMYDEDITVVFYTLNSAYRHIKNILNEE